MVSIIVPVYNAQNSLERCLMSIIRQRYPQWELILVDDGSQDDSLAICKRFCQFSACLYYQLEIFC